MKANEGALAYLIKDKKQEEEGGQSDTNGRAEEEEEQEEEEEERVALGVTHSSLLPSSCLSFPSFSFFCFRHRSFLLPTGEKKKPLGVPTKQLL